MIALLWHFLVCLDTAMDVFTFRKGESQHAIVHAEASFSKACQIANQAASNISSSCSKEDFKRLFYDAKVSAILTRNMCRCWRLCCWLKHSGGALQPLTLFYSAIDLQCQVPEMQRILVYLVKHAMNLREIEGQ